VPPFPGGKDRRNKRHKARPGFRGEINAQVHVVGTGRCLALGLAIAPAALAQAGYTPPKTSWGVPDLQGNWTNASITKMTRPAGIDALVLTPEQAKKLEDGDYNNIRTREELKPTDQKEGAPEKGKPLAACRQLQRGVG
jgi:hypothetical protein